MKLKGKKLGQTIPRAKKRTVKGVTIPKGHYVKGGKLVKVDLDKDARIIAKKLRSTKTTHWRGDVSPPSKKCRSL